MVNIRDVKINPDDWKGDKLEAIFNRQKELMEKYHEIEKDNGLLQTEDVPVNLHDRHGQARLKDFAWRVTEELGEALDAWAHREENGTDHAHEEIADALHFLTEFSILADFCVPSELKRNGVSKDKLEYIFLELPIMDGQELPFWVGEFVRALGMTCNCFKNKPWKKSHMLTDTVEFYRWLWDAWKMFAAICMGAGLSPEKLTEFYFGKAEVNAFRVRSNY